MPRSYTNSSNMLSRSEMKNGRKRRDLTKNLTTNMIRNTRRGRVKRRKTTILPNDRII